MGLNYYDVWFKLRIYFSRNETMNIKTSFNHLQIQLLFLKM